MTELFVIVFSVDDDKLTRATTSTEYVVTYEEPTASGLGAAIVENIICLTAVDIIGDITER